MQPTDCIEADFESAWYRKAADALRFRGLRANKLWQTAAIAEALGVRGCLRPGATGLGMGVGRERLASLFASLGVDVLATDQDVRSPDAAKWDNGQLAAGLDDLFHPRIIDRGAFDRHVRFEPHDMRTFEPRYVDQFDFIWHNCVVGHLGSMADSAEHLLRAGQYLRQGGWMVFTTELNVSCTDHTIYEDADTILWRLEDLRLLFDEMARAGLVGDELHLRLGDGRLDRRVCFDPSDFDRSDPEDGMLKVALGGFALTQILLCFRKQDPLDGTELDRYADSWAANHLAVQRHEQINPDLQVYRHQDPDDPSFVEAELLPIAPQVAVRMEPGAALDVELVFENRSPHTLFDLSPIKPHGASALTLGTIDPVNRTSAFEHPTWPLSSRPSLRFEPLQTSPPRERSHARPGERFAFACSLRAPDEPGEYVERFGLVFEGVGAVPRSAVEIRVSVG